MKYDLECHYIGVMYPDYLQDHHCREGELLISATIGPDTTTFAVFTMLVTDAMEFGEVIPDEIDNKAIFTAIRDMFVDLNDKGPFSGNIQAGLDEDDELPAAWAYLKWTPVE